MSTFKSALAGLALALSSSIALAHSDHGDVMPITQKQASSASEVVLKSLVETMKLNASWQTQKAPTTTLKNLKSEKVWESVYFNEKEKEPGKQHLYVYFDEMGSFLGAGHEPIKE